MANSTLHIKTTLNPELTAKRILSLIPREYPDDEALKRTKGYLKTIPNIENCNLIWDALYRNRFPSWNDLIIIADHYKASIDYLLGRTNITSVAPNAINRLDFSVKMIADYLGKDPESVCKLLGLSSDESLLY